MTDAVPPQLPDVPQAPVPHEPPKPPRWKRRRVWLAGAGAVLVLVVAGVTVYALTRPEPVDLVRDYLSVLRSGDAEAALEYTSAVADFDAVSDDLLVDEAMATDWEITHLVRRHDEKTRTATVDVTLTAADKTSRQGRFHLEDKDSDGWRILNPLVMLNVAALPMRYAEFNGVTGDPSKPKKDDEDDSSLVGNQLTPQYVWLFPGAYAAYEKSSKLLELGQETYVAVPPPIRSVEETEPIPQNFMPIIATTDDFKEELNRQLAEFIDDCATSTEINPKGCPFAGGSSTEPGSVSLDNGDDFETDVVTWKVKTYPVIDVTQGAGVFTVREVEPGEITISGKGTLEYEPDEPAEKFSGGCDIKVSSVSITLTKAETFDFAVSRTHSGLPSYTCSLRYE